jgi:hypothetical protein
MANYKLGKKEKKTEKNNWNLRNKIVTVLITIILLIIFIILLVYLNGGDFNILADRAEYVSQKPGQATSNLFKYGRVKGESGRVCGIIRNNYGQIVSGAKIQISGNEIDWATNSGVDGRFCIPPFNQEAQLILGEVLVGEYQLTATAQDYYSQTKNIAIDSGEKEEVTFNLSSVTDKLLPGPGGI